MVQLTDYSELRAPADNKVTIPLNGVKYHAIPEVPADLILEATSSRDVGDLPDVAAGTTLEALAESDPAAAVKISKASGSSLNRARQFLEDVLEPDSWEQWQANMKLPAKGLTPAQRKKHLERMISLPQMLAVFKGLLAHYSGRPTTASSPSRNGDGATGGTSTDGAPVEA